MFFSSEGTWVVWQLLPGMHWAIKQPAEIQNKSKTGSRSKVRHGFPCLLGQGIQNYQPGFGNSL